MIYYVELFMIAIILINYELILYLKLLNNYNIIKLIHNIILN